MLGLSQEPACALAPVWLRLFADAFGALEFSPVRPEDALGAFDCHSLFRHTIVLPSN